MEMNAFQEFEGPILEKLLFDRSASPYIYTDSIFSGDAFGGPVLYGFENAIITNPVYEDEGDESGDDEEY